MMDLGGNAGKGDTYRPVDSRQYAKNYEAIFKEKKMKIWVATYIDVIESEGIVQQPPPRMKQKAFKTKKLAEAWLFGLYQKDNPFILAQAERYNDTKPYTWTKYLKDYRLERKEGFWNGYVKMHTI